MKIIEGNAKDKALRLINYLSELARLRSKIIRDINEYQKVLWVHEIPREWQVGQSAQDALISLIMDRAAYLAKNNGKLLAHFTWSNGANH